MTSVKQHPTLKSIADQQTIIISNLGIAPVKISVEGVINRRVCEVGELSFDVTCNELGVIVLVQRFDETVWEVGVVGGFGFN